MISKLDSKAKGLNNFKMIPKINLKDLFHITMRRSTLITIPRLSEFFEFNNEFGPWEVFYQIVRDALDKFELYYPLFRVQKVYLVVDESRRMSSVVNRGNFEEYLKGKIFEDQLFLRPESVIGLSLNSTVGSIYPLRDYKYEDGVFTDFWYNTGLYWMASICKRPFPEHFSDSHEPLDTCSVYFMEKDADAKFKYFKDQVYVELCHYLWNMKMNMQLQNLPIDIFQGLQDDSQKVQSELDRVYDNALTASPWLM